MRTSNNSSQSLRVSETGLTWVEVLTNAQGTLTLLEAQTFRVRATGATTVTINGVLAMTMSAGEIAIFNAGKGSVNSQTQSATGSVPPVSQSPTVPVVIAGANAFVQTALV